MTRLRALWLALAEPSLARRVVLALLGALGLIWLVLVAVSYVELQLAGPGVLALPGFTQALAASLPDDEAGARVALNTTLATYARLRASEAVGLPPLLARLSRPTGAAVLASPGLPASGPEALPAEPPAFTTWSLAGRRHWLATARSAHWQLVLLEPVPADDWVIGQEMRELVQPILIAVPLLLLPLWLAVRSGLRPLRGLVARLREREPDDASPLGITLRHAELRPLISAHEALLARARQRIERERRFVQDAAHELRTPLAVIVTQAHVVAAARQPAEREAARAALELAVQRASHLVHQLLTLAQLEGDQQARPAAAPGTTPQPVELVGLVRDLIIAVAPAAAERQIELELDSPDTLPATLDRAALHSILDNLLGNAIRYIPAGGQVRVRLRPEPPGWLVLTVQDDGPGIPEAERERLFERFQRGHHPGVTGTGLGLAIVRQAAQRLGGQVRIVPGWAPSRGVGFEVRWPA